MTVETLIDLVDDVADDVTRRNHALDATIRSLTVAQRRAVMKGVHYGRGYWPLIHSLVAKGLFAGGVTPSDRLITAFGLEVRARIRERRMV